MVNKILVAVVIALTVVSCVPSDEFELYQPFTIGYGDTMVNSETGLSVTLTEVFDSRCPYFKDCRNPEASYAIVKFDVALDDEVVIIELSTDSIYEAPVDAFGYLFRLQDLSPPEYYGGCGQEDVVNERAYEAELVVTHKDCSGPGC